MSHLSSKIGFTDENCNNSVNSNGKFSNEKMFGLDLVSTRFVEYKKAQQKF